MDKDKLLNTLAAFVAKRPGFEFANYGDIAAYRSDARRAAQQLTDARTLLRYVSLRDGITAFDLTAAARMAFSGRLEIERTDRGFRIYYCAGQYFPLEYRAAVCAVLAYAVRQYLRADCTDFLAAVKREFPIGIVKRWFM